MGKMVFKKVRDWIKTAYSKFKAFFEKDNHLYTALTLIILPIVLTLAVEMLSRDSFLAGFRFLFQSPIPFFVNACIISCTVLLALLFRRRFFVYLIVSAFWLFLGIVNHNLLMKRVTPFNATDIFMVKTGMRIMGKYYSPLAIILYIVIGLAVVAFLVLVWIKGPKVQRKIHRVYNGLIVAGMVALTFVAISLSIDTGKIASTFNNLPNAYKAYGFTYCFFNSVFDNGVRKPSDYSQEGIVELVDELENNDVEITQVTDQTPNIIVIQLESFFDITRMNNLEFSTDPIPNFRKLKETYSGGYVSVPSIGAGTSNTEFEILTGMNLEDFGAGEIPFKGVLLKETCESIAYDLSENGYTAHAIHNNDATFYQRHTVYPNLGFDTFTSMEYMYLTNSDFTQKNWVRDQVLTEYIQDCLDYTPEGVDFVFTVSVEGHGSYPNQYMAGMNNVRVTSAGETQYAVQYYTNLINDMDLFVYDLVQMLEARGEKTILFLYGDHLPSLGLEQENMTDGDLMQTDYVIWNNMGLDLDLGDLEAWQVMPKLLGAVGIKTGVINSYHQTHINDEEGEYLSGLQNLEYDLLYGSKTALGDHGPYEKKDTKFGVKDVTISSVYMKTLGDKPYIYIEGENFTKWSLVNINGEYYRTEILGPDRIRAQYDDLLPQDEIFVAQVGDDKYQLSQTEPFIYE
ncbi:MAG: sulfatase-like hydrolase/transferase [Parasporobacterium sp.]|nr:sulfatase-like hydrolase/transferase [Parasporobacterium sp.]